VNAKTVFGLICLGASVAGIFVLTSKIRAQKIMLADLRHEQENLQKLNLENQRLKSAAIDQAEIARLRQETANLLRLRSEVGMLTRSGTEPTSFPIAGEPAVARLLVEREQIRVEEKDIQDLSARATCIKNLEAIALAKEHWATSNSAEKGLPITIEILVDYFPERTIPVCPSGGHYSVNRTGAAPACSVEGHAIP